MLRCAALAGLFGFDSRYRFVDRFCDLYGRFFRMWESLAIRRLGVPESVGSNPTILTDMGTCSRESSAVPTRVQRVRLLPSLLAAL